MKVLRRILYCLTICFCASQPAQAQGNGHPPPIDLGIPQILQETQVWCWVAVVEQIAHWKQGTIPVQSPHQCELVSVANNYSQPLCCSGLPQFAQACVRTGQTQEIMGLLQFTGAGFATYSPPANPMVLYQTLASGRPIILQIQTTPFAGHVVVLRGMAWEPTPMGIQPVLLINDPLSYFTKPVLFQDLLPYWQAAIVVN